MLHFRKTFVTMMVPGSSSGKKPMAEPHIIPWRREHKGLSPKQAAGVMNFTAEANRLAKVSRHVGDPKAKTPRYHA
jgi:hypothetical protein